MNMKVGIDGIKNILAVGSGKGGVGKSTVATNLAKALAYQGKKVGLLDADLYGPCQPGMMGSDQAPKGNGNIIVPVEKDGVKFVSMGLMNPSGKALIIRAPLAIKAVQQFLTGVQWGELDYLFIDLPPGTGDIQLTLAQQAKLSGAIIVTTPQKVASDIAKKGLEMFVTVNVPIIGIVENMSGYKCPKCEDVTPVFGKGGGVALSEEFKVPLLAQVPIDPQLLADSDTGETSYDTGKEGFYQSKFVELSKEIEREIEKAQEQSKEFETSEISVTDHGLLIKWSDESESNLGARKVRLACPCASCVDEVTGKRILKPENVSMNIKILGVKPVGRYGIAINFSDGHGTGIYKFKTLKAMSSAVQDSFSV